jgi:hypothetical protein
LDSFSGPVQQTPHLKRVFVFKSATAIVAISAAVIVKIARYVRMSACLPLRTGKSFSRWGSFRNLTTLRKCEEEIDFF